MTTPPNLKRVPVEQMRLGMHLHEMCGAWLDHPFWKTKFVLREPADLAKLQESGIKECWIDVTKGLDVATPDDGEPSAQRPVGSAGASRRVVVDVDTATDLARAAAVSGEKKVEFAE